MKNFNFSSSFCQVLAFIGSVLLASCGGGSGVSTSSTDPITPPPSTYTPDTNIIDNSLFLIDTFVMSSEFLKITTREPLNKSLWALMSF